MNISELQCPLCQIYYKGVFGDCCSTKVIGVGDETSFRLRDVARDSTLAAIKKCRPGEPLRTIGATIG